MNDRIQRLNMIILILVIIYTIIIQKYILQLTIINSLLSPFITFLTSIGFYRILIIVLYNLISSNEFFLKLYWGRLYIHGFWSYTYVIEGSNIDDNKRYFGVWRFEQDLYETRLIGFGLNDNFGVRSQVRSVTDMIENQGAYEIVNVRTDYVDPGRDYYSKTSIFFDLNKSRLLKYPLKFRSKTIIYGGVFTGKVHKDLFIKHESAKSEDDVIEQLKSQYDLIQSINP